MSVINVRKANLNELGYNDLEDWLKNPDHVYIGRNMVFYVPGAKASKWANPFNVKKYGRDECLKLYKKHIMENPKLMKRIRKELQGKVLGCWCKPEACHGDVLLKILEELEESDDSD
jgi:hypothetical protein